MNSFKLCVYVWEGMVLRENAAHLIVPVGFLKQVNIVNEVNKAATELRLMTLSVRHWLLYFKTNERTHIA